MIKEKILKMLRSRPARKRWGVAFKAMQEADQKQKTKPPKATKDK